MTLTQAAIYFSLWSLVWFFAVCWLRHFGLLMFSKMWEHILISILLGFVTGAGWKIAVDELFLKLP